MLRSAAAVVAGYAVAAVLTMATFLVLFPAMRTMSQAPSPPIPSRSQMFVILAMGIAAAVAGGWIAGLVARRAPFRHGLALGGLMVVLGAVHLVMNFGQEPLWFELALMAIGLSGAALGGWLRQVRARPSITPKRPSASG